MTNNAHNYTNPRSSSIDVYFDSFINTIPQQLPLVLWTDDVANASWESPIRHMDFLSLYIARQGRGVHIIEGIPFEISRGDVYAMGIGMAHQFKDDTDLILDTIHFKPDIFTQDTLNVLETIPGFTKLYSTQAFQPTANFGNLSRWMHLSPDRYQQITSIYRRLYNEWADNSEVGAIMSQAYLLQLFVILAREYDNRLPRRLTEAVINLNDNMSAIASAVQFIDENYAESISVESLASSAFLSSGRFTELFRMEMGCTPRDYIRHVRLEHAKTLLTSTNMSISEVAQNSGFGESAYLTRVFRQSTGIQPSKYRLKYK